jgi:hypothetical protein
MTVSSHYTFIQCESGPNPQQIGLVNRNRIRAQVMRTSWSHKKALRTKAALSKVSHNNHTPTHKSLDIPLCHSLVKNRQCCTASTFRSIITTGPRDAKVGSVLEQSRTGLLPQNDVLLSMRGRQLLCQDSGGYSHASSELGQLYGDDSPTPEERVEETQMCKWVDEEYLGLQACFSLLPRSGSVHF